MSPRRHALVLGASVAGLCAAQALAGCFDSVTLVDRDALPDEPAVRKGAPQGSQLHILLSRGARDLNLLFPGVLRDLAAGGCPVLEDFSSIHAYFGGHLQHREVAVGFPLYLSSRPFLETAIRRRLSDVVTVRQGVEVLGLLGDRERVTGARLSSGEVDAELVVDATGRSGRAVHWLGELGVAAPTEETVEVDIVYSAGLASMEPPGADEAFFVSAIPDRPWGLGMHRQENDRWIINAYGYAGHHPPADHAALIDLASRYAPEHWRRALSTVQWLGSPQTMRYPRSVRRRYDRAALPDGIVVVGDALCSFNPIYGQGMTMAVGEAVALRECLAESDVDVTRRFYARTRRDVDTVWQLGGGGDLRFASVPGRRPVYLRLLNRYVDAVLATTAVDRDVCRTFWRVNFLLDPPQALFTPRVLAAVARCNIRPKRCAMQHSDVTLRTGPHATTGAQND